MGSEPQPVAEVMDSRVSGMGTCKFVASALIAKMHTWLWSRAGGVRKLEERDRR